MQLKSFGCSFIFGTDLHDDGRGGPYARASQHSWPALIAQHKKIYYNCFARPGSGNFRILEQVLIQSNDAYPEQLFVIGWTWIDRFDYVVYDTDRDKNNWQTLMPVDESKVSDYYYRNLHSQYRDKLNTLICIKQAIDVLLTKQIPFVMTYMDPLIFETNWHTSSAVAELQDFVRPHLITFEGKNFLDWSRDNGYAISATKHPLEDAHRAAATYLLDTSSVLQST
jgi:hypothetical protein